MILKKLFLLVFLYVFSQAFSQNTNSYNLLWKIEGNGLKKPSYLFGTMHVRDARAFNFSDSVMVSIENCSAFAMEIHPDTMMMDVFNGMFNSDSAISKLKDVLSKTDYDKLEQKFKNEYGYSIEKLKVKNPYVIRSMLNRSKSNSTDKATFLDAYLLGISKTLGKNIFGLEKTNDQISFFNSLSEEKIKEEFTDIINSDSEQNESFREKLIDIYSKGNIYEIEKELYLLKTLDSAMVKRNRVMVKSMLAIMQNNTLFTAVGVAHLPGKEGVIQLLKDKGYTVKPVAATFTGLAKKYSVDLSKVKWQRYTDSINGFSIESPGSFLDMKLNENLETKFYFDLTNILSYGYYVINMSNSETELNEKKMIETIIETYRKSDKYSVEKTKYLNKDGTSMREVIIKTSERNSLRLRLFIKNNILYGIFVGGETSKINYPETEKYFNSFTVLAAKPKKDPKWISFNQPEGAFSIALPLEPKAIAKEVTSSSETALTYTLNMYLSTNLSSMTNYLIRYNDYPSQMYVNKKENIFTAIINEVKSTNKIVSGPDTIWKDGYEGRKFTCFIQDKYFTEGRIFVRGNRTYFLLKQNLAANSTKMLNDDFFNSFAFEPYKKTTPYLLVPDNEDFEITLPAEPKIIPDTSNLDQNSFKNITDYYSTNPNSGGLYQFEYSELSDFFKVKNLTEYYANFIKNFVGYSDSLVSSDSIMINGFYGRECVIYKWQEDYPKRIRLWIAHNKLFYMASYVGRDELFNDESNLIFNSFKFNKNKTETNIYSSKTEKILNGLYAKDSATYKRAIGAFTFYEFEKEDLAKLTKELNSVDKNKVLSDDARALIIEAIGTLKDTTAYSTLVKEYNSTTNSDKSRLNAITAITKIDKVKGFSLYLDLLLSGKVIKMNGSYWSLFSPLRDSIELTREKFEKLLPLFDHDEYRESLLQTAYSISTIDSTTTFAKKYFNALTKYAFSDLDVYFKNLGDTSKYDYHSEIFNYLNLMELSQNSEVADKYTSKLLAENRADDYYQNSAITLRIKLNLPVNKKLLDAKLNSLETRSEILYAYEKINALDKVSSKYLKPKELGKMMLYSYIIDDADAPAKIEPLGTIVKGDTTFYAYTFSFEGDDKEYLGIGGPFTKGKKIELDNLYGTTNFEEKEKDWKEQALNLIADY